MIVEQKRGCGWRKVGGLYLIGAGRAVPCDMLPLELTPCPTCGYEIPFYRGFMWLKKDWIAANAEGHHLRLGAGGVCKCYEAGRPDCPICFPHANDLERYGLMWVGSRFYTPASFAKEGDKMGVCKRISKIPKGLTPDTWILCAHKKVPFSDAYGENGLRTNEPEYKPAIFYAFRPVRIEKLIWKSKATKRRLKKLRDAGITPVIIEDGTKKHVEKKRKKRRRTL